MNKKLIFKILGIILGIEGVSLLIPFVIALVCRENTAVFGITALLCLAVGLPLSRLHTAKSRLQNRDGYVAVALGWIVLSAFGALPYALSGCCGYVDALFETVSGFTAALACISNIGPGMGQIGPASCFNIFSAPVKMGLAVIMLLGRLELYPILAFFAPTTWRK